MYDPFHLDKTECEYVWVSVCVHCPLVFICNKNNSLTLNSGVTGAEKVVKYSRPLRFSLDIEETF